MYRFWDSIIRPTFELTQPKMIVEIGASDGKNTSLLLGYCRTHAAALCVIDPLPSFDTKDWTEKNKQTLTIRRGKSLDELPEIKRTDAVLIDGDHNWFTVFHELKHLERLAQSQGFFPLVFLHDLDWPYARRDLYYRPEDIPEKYRKPCTQKGIVLDEHGLANGLGLNNDLFHANEEGGPQNGVLTAVEDFLKETKWNLRFVRVAGMHGLGILAPDTLLRAHHSLGQLLDTLEPSPSIAQHLQAVDRARLHSMTLESVSQAHLKSYGKREEELRRESTETRRQWTLKEGELRKQLAEGERMKEALKEELAQSMRDLKTLQTETVEQKKHIQQQQDVQTSLEQQIQRVRKDMAQQEATCANLEYQVTCLRDTLLAESEKLERLQRTRSWKLTAPLRKIETFLRKKKVQPSVETPTAMQPANMKTEQEKDLERTLEWARECRNWGADLKPSWIQHYVPTVAVVIPCHDYGRYLKEALDSVLAQTRPPDDIVVVDDSSTDDTPQVAASFADRGVRYVRGEWKSVGAARNAGLAATKADFLVFLDADDLLHPDYVRSGVNTLMNHLDAALAYTDQQYFGVKKMHYRAPETFDSERFDAVNHCHPASMVRRDALLQAGGWSHGIDEDGDWITWRKVLQLGWKAVKSDGLFFYRTHDRNMHVMLNAKRSYAERAGFLEAKITLCLSLSGRTWAWPMTSAFLEGQTFPHRLMRLIVLDTSQDAEFAEEVKRWLASCDYDEYSYLTANVGRKGLANLARGDVALEVASACGTIYNRFARLAETPLVCFLEDDMSPPLDVYPRLIRLLQPDVVSVSASCFHRNRDRKPIACGWSPNGHPIEIAEGAGITAVGANGFGCAVIRGEYLRKAIFRNGPGVHCFDHNFYRDLVFEKKLKALVDWGCVCRHHQNADTWF